MAAGGVHGGRGVGREPAGVGVDLVARQRFPFRPTRREEVTEKILFGIVGSVVIFIQVCIIHIFELKTCISSTIFCSFE